MKVALPRWAILLFCVAVLRERITLGTRKGGGSGAAGAVDWSGIMAVWVFCVMRARRGEERGEGERSGMPLT